jgi:hypothetical protein
VAAARRQPPRRKRARKSRSTARTPRRAFARTRESFDRAHGSNRRTMNDAEASLNTGEVDDRGHRHACFPDRSPKQTTEGNTPESSCGNRPKTLANSTRRFVQRAVSYLLTRPQNGRFEPNRLPRPKANSPRRTSLPTEVGIHPRQRHQIQCVVPSLTERSNRPDDPRAACLLHPPKDPQRRKPPAARAQRHLP